MKKRPLTHLGVKIKNRLTELNKTQYELAKEIGTSSNYLYLIMTGERSGRSYLPKIGEVLGIEELKSA